MQNVINEGRDVVNLITPLLGNYAHFIAIGVPQFERIIPSKEHISNNMTSQYSAGASAFL